LEWVEGNAEVLKTIDAGTRCSRFYVPLQTHDGEDRIVMNTHLDMHQDCRDVARCLVIRAMLRLGEGKIDDARRDLLSCHRLGRLMGQTPFLICALVCYEIDATAWRGDAALMRYGNMTATDALDFQRELRELPPLPGIADNTDHVDRVQLLDAV